MKRYGNLYDLIICDENLELALYNASIGKHDYDEVKDAFKDKDEKLKELKAMLVDKTYKCSEYTKFNKNDNGKVREIFKLPFFPDRIIQHAILQILEPIWKKTLISHTFQSIKGRGVHSCLVEVRRAVQVDSIQYCLQIDVKKFYPSVDNELLKIVVQKKIKCKDTLSLLYSIIDGEVGLPIGNYISQYLGNLFLSELDHHIKEKLKVKCYYRYCDDLLILSNDKDELWNVLDYINKYFESINLKVKENYQVYKIDENRGVSCLGYVVFPNKVKIRRNIVDKFKLHIKEMEDVGGIDISVLGSYYGWFKHCDSVSLWVKMTKNLRCIVDKQDYVRLNKLTIKLKKASRARRIK